MSEQNLRVTLVRSPIGYNKRQKETVKALGLRKMNASVVVRATPQIRGMLEKVKHLVRIEATDDEAPRKVSPVMARQQSQADEAAANAETPETTD